MDIAAIHREILEGAWSGGSLDVLAQYADDYVFTGPLVPEPMRGPDGERELIALYRNAFPDLRFAIDEQLVDADGRRVATRWTATGTHEGELLGIPATGKPGRTSGVSLARFENGKLVAVWSMWDALGLLTQLGVIPEPATV